jgi:hypothetical protein
VRLLVEVGAADPLAAGEQILGSCIQHYLCLLTSMHLSLNASAGAAAGGGGRCRPLAAGPLAADAPAGGHPQRGSTTGQLPVKQDTSRYVCHMSGLGVHPLQAVGAD